MDAAAVFRKAPFVAALGIEPESIGDGRCRSRLELTGHHLQQDGYVHAGVLATMADHSAGAAAASLLPKGEIVLTAEFKISLMRAARGERLRCDAEVIKPGSRVSFAESTVYCESGGVEQMVARATVSLAVVPSQRLAAKGGGENG
jgi:uncharacterized protein (TIGR00369 family)